MSDNVVKLQFDLAQTDAALQKSREECKKLREEVKKCKDEMKNAGDAGSLAYQKQSTELRKTASEAEKTSNKIRSMGGALNQIGGAGTGQIAQVAGAIGMLTSPIGLVVGALGAVGLAWQSIADDAEKATKRMQEANKTQKEINASMLETNTKKAETSVVNTKHNSRAILEYGVKGQEYIDEYSSKHRMKKGDTSEVLSIVSGFASKWKKGELDTLMASVEQLSDLGMAPQDAAKEIAADSFTRTLAKRNSVHASKNVVRNKTGHRLSDIEYLEILSTVRNLPGFSEIKNQNVIDDSPTPSGSIAKLLTIQKRLAAFERRFPGVTKAYESYNMLEWRKREKTKEIQKLEEEMENDFSGPSLGNPSRPDEPSRSIIRAYALQNIWSGMKFPFKAHKLSGWTGEGGLKGELNDLEKQSKENDKQRGFESPTLTKDVLKMFGDLKGSIEELSRQMSINSTVTGKNTTATETGMGQ